MEESLTTKANVVADVAAANVAAELVAPVVPLLPSPAADDDAWRAKIATLQHEFNAQRARMKEIFLQKETDCRQLRAQLDDVRSQLAVAALRGEDGERKAQAEICSLQQLVQETIDESSDSKAQTERLFDEVERLRAENGRLSEELVHFQQEANNSSGGNSLVPVLSHVKKTIARKLGADTTGTDYLEDSMRKAQEDAEVLRSLVVPLEEEIKALKEKLRTTDEELQTCQRAAGTHKTTGGIAVQSALVGLLERTVSPTPTPTQPPPATSTTAPTETDSTADASAQSSAQSPPSPPPIVACADCLTYADQLDTLQTSLTAARKDSDHFRVELEREAALRRDLEQQWQEKREEHKHQVQSLEERVAGTEREFAALRQFYGEAKEEMRRQVARLSNEREQTARHLEQLQNDNDFLAGRFAATAAELQSQRIDLPCNVDDLQVCLLRAHEDLIETKVGYELEQRRSHTYWDESRLLAEKQLEYEHDAETKVKTLRARIGHLEAERAKLHVLKDTLQQRETDFERQAAELRVQEIDLRASNERLTQQNAELRQKGTVLQQELANIETVQQDFVRLSQSLQVQLEKIRAADSTVRWQDEDDVDQCPTCRSAFAVTRRQVNCRHCGTIYCEKCITKSVMSGRGRKPARVCDVCHTLLERNTAPYFSQAPPQSPT